MLKSLSILEKMHPDDTNVFASNIIDKSSHQAMSAKKAEGLPIEPDEIKSYTDPVSRIGDVKVNSYIIVLKNELDEMRKGSRPCVIRFHKVSKLKSPEEQYLRLLQLYMPWRNENELRQDNQIYEDRQRD